MKQVLLAVIVFIVCTHIKLGAQELPKIEKKIYVSSDRKVYVNKSLPTYYFISTSPSPNAPSIRLKSENSDQYTNPMYFDAEGKKTFRSPSAMDTVTKKLVLPLRDIQYEIYVDGKAPATKIAFDLSKTYIANGVHFVAPLSVNFNASDDLSGVAKTYVSIDQNSYTTFEGPLNLDIEKEYDLKYFSTDNTGNVESMKEIKFSVDKNSPVSKLEITGERSENILPGNAFFTLSAEDKTSGVKATYYSIDDSVFRLYQNKISTHLLSEGEHKLYYYSVDHVKNIEKVNTFSFYIDKTPPQVIQEVMGKTFIANGKEFSAGTSKLKITSFDNKAGVKEIYYSINNAPYEKYDKPIVLSGYKGTLLVNSYAVDNVGNKSSMDLANAKKNGIPYIDLSAPWVGYDFKGPTFTSLDTVFISNRTSLVLEAKDAESGIARIEYQIDSSELKIYSSPLSIVGEGYHRISVYGYDNTENLTRQQVGVVVDTTGPRIFERFSSPSIGTIQEEGKKLDVYPNHAVLFLSATDDRAGFDDLLFQLNNHPELPYLKDIRGFTQGRNVIKMKAIDKLGNITQKTIEFYIK